MRPLKQIARKKRFHKVPAIQNNYGWFCIDKKCIPEDLNEGNLIFPDSFQQVGKPQELADLNLGMCTGKMT